jgi:N-acetylglutamate synthase-like GNAT family acetyltransferase
LKLPHGFKNANATGKSAMNPPALRIRRATVDDLDAVKTIWDAMRFSPSDLEKRLTEFQVVVDAAGQVLGAVGIKVSGQHALLYSEGYSDFGIADSARQLFWERIQTLAANVGVFRLWTQERSPYWKNFGFQPPNSEAMNRLPNEWKNEFDGGWLTFQLKNEDVIAAALEKKFVPFMAGEKSGTKKISERARKLNQIIIITGFGIGIICAAITIYLLVHRSPFSR